MSDLYIHEKLRKIISERINQIEDQVLRGPIEDLSTLKELRGRLAELAASMGSKMSTKEVKTRQAVEKWRKTRAAKGD